MRFKPVPNPPSDPDDCIVTLRSVQSAVPDTPTKTDCCTLLIERTDLQTRAQAETWLTFLRALELVEAASDGYRRRSDTVCCDSLPVIAPRSADHRLTRYNDPDETPATDSIRSSFVERVHGVESVVGTLDSMTDTGDTLEATPTDETEWWTVEAIETALDERSSGQRRRHPRFESERRLQNVLDWGVAFGVFDRREGDRIRYRLSEVTGGS